MAACWRLRSNIQTKSNGRDSKGFRLWFLQQPPRYTKNSPFRMCQGVPCCTGFILWYVFGLTCGQALSKAMCCRCLHHATSGNFVHGWTPGEGWRARIKWIFKVVRWGTSYNSSAVLHPVLANLQEVNRKFDRFAERCRQFDSPGLSARRCCSLTWPLKFPETPKSGALDLYLIYNII